MINIYSLLPKVLKNNSKANVDLFHYSQITRKEKPQVQDFYILHEGLVGVIDETLQEEDYDDVKDKNQKYQGTSGWLGITDKYWLTAIVPQKNKPLMQNLFTTLLTRLIIF